MRFEQRPAPSGTPTSRTTRSIRAPSPTLLSSYAQCGPGARIIQRQSHDPTEHEQRSGIYAQPGKRPQFRREKQPHQTKPHRNTAQQCNDNVPNRNEPQKISQPNILHSCSILNQAMHRCRLSWPLFPSAGNDPFQGQYSSGRGQAATAHSGKPDQPSDSPARPTAPDKAVSNRGQRECLPANRAARTRLTTHRTPPGTIRA